MNNKSSPVLVIIAKINLQLTLPWFSWAPLSFHQTAWGSSWLYFFLASFLCLLQACNWVTLSQARTVARAWTTPSSCLPKAHWSWFCNQAVSQCQHGGISKNIVCVSTGVTFFAPLVTSNHSIGLKWYLWENNVLALLRTCI